MDADLKSRLIYELKILKNRKQEFADRLDLLEPYRNTLLKRDRNRRGGYYYSIKPEGFDKFKYVGKGSDPKIMRVKEAAFLQKSITLIDKNIKFITDLLDGYQEFDFQSVNLLLPKTYRSEKLIASSAYQAAGKRWKAEKLAFQKQFPENYPEHKTERTSDGTMVKSKNEAHIYDRFLDAGFYHIYELPLPSKDYGPPLYPDFTILSPIDLKTEIIVEHVGKLDDLKYGEGFAARVRRYILNGYIPGVNLFFTFNDKDGHIDSIQINKVIADVLGIR